MKGPGLRIENDVRRIWRCPSCGRESRALGDVVVMRCGCTSDGTPMRLMEGRRQVRQFSRPLQPHEVSAAEVTGERPTDSPQPATLPMNPVMDASVIDQPVESGGFGEGLMRPTESPPTENGQTNG